MRGVLDYGDGVCAVAAWIGPDNGAARPQVHSSPQSKQRIGPIFPALHDAGARAELAFRFVAPMRTKMAWRLSMNRPFGVHPLGCPKRKDTLKRGHPTALCRFMAPMSVQSWRSKLPMNLSGVPALAGPVRLRECHRLKPGLQTRRGSWLRFTLERGSNLPMNLFGVPALAGPVRLRKCHRLKPGLQTRRGSWSRFTRERGSGLSMNRPFGVHPLGCPKRKDTLKRAHRTALCRFMVPMRVQSWTSKLSMNLFGVPALAGPVRLRRTTG